MQIRNVILGSLFVNNLKYFYFTNLKSLTASQRLVIASLIFTIGT